jgi:hypothetical protein
MIAPGDLAVEKPRRAPETALKGCDLASERQAGLEERGRAGPQGFRCSLSSHGWPTAGEIMCILSLLRSLDGAAFVLHGKDIPPSGVTDMRSAALLLALVLGIAASSSSSAQPELGKACRENHSERATVLRKPGKARMGGC